MTNRELCSWKEIADHLGVTPRTAQKWEKERGLPVRRLPGGHGRVIALAEELDAWRLPAPNATLTESSPVPPASSSVHKISRNLRLLAMPRDC